MCHQLCSDFLQIIAIPDLFLYNNATSMKKGELLCLTSAANAVISKKYRRNGIPVICILRP